MTNPAHNLLDQLMNEVKKNLVDHQIEKMKTEILNVVDKKQENFLQDMVQICDSIYRETVDASMHAAAQMIQNEKQEMLDLIWAMVQKEVSIEVEKLKMAVEKEKEEEVGPPMGEDTQPPRAILVNMKMAERVCNLAHLEHPEKVLSFKKKAKRG